MQRCANPLIARKATLAVLCAVWIAGVVVGMSVLLRYANKPGPTVAPPPVWPAASAIARTPGHYTLMLSAHPHCPCTSATLGELEIIMRHCAKNLDSHVLFVKPPGFPAQWEQTDLWADAARIPGVHPATDENGVESHRFNAATSGEVALYNPAGRLVFHGGITASRGHSGDNAGRDAIINIITSHQTASAQTPVFGCALFDADSRCPACKGAAK